jgi:hypothetical protein
MPRLCRLSTYFFPETNGRSLEEIDEIFVQSRSIFDPPRLARSLPKMHVVDKDFDMTKGGESDYAETKEAPKD